MEVDAEEAFQKTILLSEPGPPGSGAARFAAAMWFYNEKRLSAPMLEIFRRCVVYDDEDPLDLARFEGVGGFPVTELRGRT